jgi:hypothetical protein
MPTNVQMERCIARERGALVFWSPDLSERPAAAQVQIIDVFALQVATGCSRDTQGRLVLEAQPTVAAGRSWSLAMAAQLICNDARPHRWVALQLDKRAWGLFWAGGGLQQCRELLSVQGDLTATFSKRPFPASWLWRTVAWSLPVWLVVVGFCVAGLLVVLQHQHPRVERMFERTAPATPAR